VTEVTLSPQAQDVVGSIEEFLGMPRASTSAARSNWAADSGGGSVGSNSYIAGSITVVVPSTPTAWEVGRWGIQ
jgi:hypothetical protein